MLGSRTKQWTMMSRVFTKDQERSRPKHCPLAGEDEDSDDVDVDLAVDDLLENRGHRRRTRFKPSLLSRFPRFRQSKTPSFGQLSTPLDVDDTPERLRGQNRSKTRAVLSRSRRQDGLNRIVARRRGESFPRPPRPVSSRGFRRGVEPATNRKFLRLGENGGPSCLL